MKSDFYRAFEEKYRGPREGIKLRLQVYRQFIEPIKALYSDLKAVDLGCGRGEWLEVLVQAGFYPHGVDVDDGMLADCKALGLSYVKEDAIEHLKSLPDESQVIVSGIHIAEHLPFSALQALVIEALRVLKPCGLLILETPNPENIAVSATNFYLDPTHERPLPPDLLIFLTDYYGFARSKILRLNESPELSHSDQAQLYDVIAGTSPDYAVIAQKKANDSLLKAFDAPFGLELGLTMSTLAQRHDTKIGHKINGISQRIVSLEARAQESEERAAEATRRASEAEARVLTLLTSTSWRITGPLRKTMLAIKWLLVLTKRFIRWVVRLPKSLALPLLVWGIRRTLVSHHLKARILVLLATHPQLKQRLRQFAIRSSLKASRGMVSANLPDESITNLSPSAQKIFNDLKRAMESVKS